jgi:hypothetical protein
MGLIDELANGAVLRTTKRTDQKTQKAFACKLQGKAF